MVSSLLLLTIVWASHRLFLHQSGYYSLLMEGDFVFVFLQGLVRHYQRGLGDSFLHMQGGLLLICFLQGVWLLITDYAWLFRTICLRSWQ